MSDKIQIEATENTKAYVYVQELGSYMPVEASVAEGIMTLDVTAGVPYVVSSHNIAQSIVKEGWNKINDTWYVVGNTGALVKGWYNDNGTWYNLSNEGKMNTGWILDSDGKWYMLDRESGAMRTGWFKDIDNKWYYLNGNGSMASDTVVDGYKLGNDGAWIQ